MQSFAGLNFNLQLIILGHLLKIVTHQLFVPEEVMQPPRADWERQDPVQSRSSCTSPPRVQPAPESMSPVREGGAAPLEGLRGFAEGLTGEQDLQRASTKEQKVPVALTLINGAPCTPITSWPFHLLQCRTC